MQPSKNCWTFWTSSIKEEQQLKNAHLSFISQGRKNFVRLNHMWRFGSSVVRALAMLAGDLGSIPGQATNFFNFSEGIGKP